MELGRAGLRRRDEARADPDALGAPGEVRGEATPVKDGASTDDVHGLAIERRGVALHGVNARGDEDRCRDVARVAAALPGLRADEVDADFERLLYVLRVADHVHDEDAGFVELVDGPLGRYADCRDEEGGALFDDDLNEVRELTIGVVGLQVNVAKFRMAKMFLGSTYVGLASAATDLGKEEIDTEGCLGVIEVLLDQLDLEAKLSSSFSYMGADTTTRDNSALPPSRWYRGSGAQALTCWRRIFGVYPIPPITPRPPAFVTAAASSGPAATFILRKASAHAPRRLQWELLQHTQQAEWGA